MRKSIISLIVILLFACISCDKENGMEEKPLSVTNAQVNFTHHGGDGVIEVMAKQSVDALASHDWFTVLVKGNEISITVQPNYGKSDRSGYVKISSDQEQEIVNVYQTGIAFINGDKILYSTFDGDLLSILLNNNLDGIELTAFVNDKDKEMIEPEIKDDILYVKVNENTSKKPINFFVYLAVKKADNTVEVADSIMVRSTFGYKDLIGTWTANFDNGSYFLEEEVEIKEGNVLTGLSLYAGGKTKTSLSIKYVEANETLLIPFGDMIAQDGKNYVFIVPRTAAKDDGGWSYWGPWLDLQPYEGYLEVGEDGTIIFNFPNFSNGGSTVGGFTFYKFKVKDPVDYSTTVGTIRSILNLKLTKVK